MKQQLGDDSMARLTNQALALLSEESVDDVNLHIRFTNSAVNLPLAPSSCYIHVAKCFMCLSKKPNSFFRNKYPGLF